jgi:hypothetical protein
MEKSRTVRTEHMIYQEASFDNIDDMLEQKAIMEEIAEFNKELLSILRIERKVNIDRENNIYTYSEFAIQKFALN